MTVQQDRSATPRAVNGRPITAAGKVHVDPPVVDNAPPTRSKVAAALAAMACAACCALPFLITAGVLTGAGAALAQDLLLAGAGVLVAAAGAMWWLHRRRNVRRAAAAGRSECANGTCACSSGSA
jgi:mercuric ion transport protein